MSENKLPETLSERLRYRATAFQDAPLGNLMIEAAKFIETRESDNLYAICGGGDWNDASVEHLILPDGLDIDEEKIKWRTWYREKYAGKKGVEYIFFIDWLLKAGARVPTEEEVKVWVDLE